MATTTTTAAALSCDHGQPVPAATIALYHLCSTAVQYADTGVGLAAVVAEHTHDSRASVLLAEFQHMHEKLERGVSQLTAARFDWDVVAALTPQLLIDIRRTTTLLLHLPLLVECVSPAARHTVANAVASVLNDSLRVLESACAS